jgi:hypothetical protein
MASETKRSATKLFIALILLVLILGTGGFLVSQYLGYKKEIAEENRLENLSLKADVLAFVSQHLPDIHAELVRMNYQIRIIDREIVRINLMEKEFPDQRKIILSEKKTWDSTRKTLSTGLLKLEADIEALYVTYMINPAKGLAELESKRAELLKTSQEILNETGSQTERLQHVEEKSFFTMLKRKFITPYLSFFE